MRLNFYVTVTALALLASSSAAGQQGAPSATEVVERMTARDGERQQSLEGYKGMRRYTLVNEHMRKRAEMTVRVNGDSDGTKRFEVTSEEGWKAAHKHVLHKMLESEQETSHPAERAKARLCAENYEFQMLGVEPIEGRAAYVIELNPKRHDKYLFRGRIWVDVVDYALVRADGNPAKNPSFWTKSVHFTQKYRKAGPFWFPYSTESVTEARIFGRTDVTINYFDYVPNSQQGTAVSSNARTNVNEENHDQY